MEIRGGGVNFAYRTVIDCTPCQGRLLRNIQTIWGENFVDFHHRLLSKTPFEVNRVDLSTWYQSKGENAKAYYYYDLTFYIYNGILFENFITNEKEEEFSRTTAFPTFKEVENYFGVKPLIVPIAPHETASDIYWRCYPSYLEEIVLKSLYPHEYDN
jgi:hypothetical protein